jgi:hypothetical protein
MDLAKQRFSELQIMYYRYKHKKPIDKQRLIAILRKEDTPEKDRLTYAELTSFFADCLDDEEVLYLPKHNQKKLGWMDMIPLCGIIAFHTYKKEKAPRETAINEFAESFGCSARHVRKERKRFMTDAEFERDIAENIEYLIERDKEKD